MTSLTLVGLGAVGVRAARQLADGEEFDRLHLVDRDRARADRVAKNLGATARAADWSPGEPLPEGTSVVASAVPDPLDAAVARAAVDAGVHYVSSIDSSDAIDHRFTLESEAEAKGCLVLPGAGLAPGLADVLARHGADGFDTVEEVRVARSGWAGPASVATLRSELRGVVVDWHDAAWRTLPRSGEEIVWFPDPIGARSCEPVRLGLRLLVDGFDGVSRASMATSEPVGRVRFRRHRHRGDEAEWGAARVEVWGRTAGASNVVVLGVIDRTEIAAGTMLAVASLAAGGFIDAGLPSVGVHGLASAARPVALVSELASRGVRAAVFEGAPISD